MSDAMQVFDRSLVRRRRERAAPGIGRVAPVLEDAADRLLDRLDDTTRRFARALDLGGRGVVAPALRARGVECVVSMDLAPGMARRAGGLPLAADEEWLPFAPGSFDLVVASLSLHWVNDLPGTLLQIRRALAPDGLFLASLPALGTLQPLREALATAESGLRDGLSPRISPFPELRDGAALLQRAGFAMPVADRERIGLRYRTPLALLRDLQAAGESNAVLARDPRTPPRALFPLALGALPLDSEGLLPVSLELLTLTGWAPGPNQPQPAPRGSGQVSLAAALGTVEHRSGDTPH
ncbi:methyltransferase domain-containing protein [Pseudoroseomonas cervicalis]|uniref:methyltransferase domain-containing protein n=1 Tax=Teichococcus cervicalis TaxID=204525 RepID=UPI0022F15E18|nr:methyltransferase domain-containing protein [Pseudoroseomonas cervicalis]WBV44461.1 methyltransferase domain-containing protein [Pseudoroseomonas cervicalis]